jgi:hypothetical protein
VTTILANLVGRSVVSAITQTPASGPLAPVTTPPISAALTATVCAMAVGATSASAATATPEYNACLTFIAPSMSGKTANDVFDRYASNSSRGA